MAALVQAVRRLCFRLGTSTGLFEPTAAQTAAVHRAFLERFDIKHIDEVALNIFSDLRRTGQDLPLYDIKRVLKAVYQVQKQTGINK